MSSEGYGHMEGREVGLSFPLQSPLLSANSSFSPRSPTGASGQRFGQGLNMSETCTSCFVCDRQPQLPRPTDLGDGKGGESDTTQGHGLRMSNPRVVYISFSPPQHSPMAPDSVQLHQKASPWLSRISMERGNRELQMCHSPPNLEHLHVKKKVQQPRNCENKPMPAIRTECLQ